MPDFLSYFALLDPKGAIALAERGLMVQATLFMLIVAVPVFALIFFFAWRYRASNTKAAYVPDWEHSKMEELIWWAIPLEIVLVLGALTWTSTHELDPPRPLSDEAPLVIQAVALEWKWLFIYPEEGIASVNYVALPVGKQVRFDITADAPMNAFWIPRLGGMIYAMTGMATMLHLVADEEGTYNGLSSNYSGEGFAKMKFIAEAVSEEKFEEWTLRAKTSSLLLSSDEYERLREPSMPPAPSTYSGVENNLFNSIIARFNTVMSTGTEGSKTWPSGPERTLPHRYE